MEQWQTWTSSIKGKGKLNGKGTQVIKAGISYEFIHLVVLVMEITQKEIRFVRKRFRERVFIIYLNWYSKSSTRFRNKFFYL